MYIILCSSLMCYILCIYRPLITEIPVEFIKYNSCILLQQYTLHIFFHKTLCYAYGIFNLLQNFTVVQCNVIHYICTYCSDCNCDKSTMTCCIQQNWYPFGYTINHSTFLAMVQCPFTIQNQTLWTTLHGIDECCIQLCLHHTLSHHFFRKQFKLEQNCSQ